MAFGEIIVSVGLFVISTVVAVYLIRYSNSQLTQCLVSLEDKHNEIIDLNTKLARQILHSDKKIKGELESLRIHHTRVTPRDVEAKGP